MDDLCPIGPNGLNTSFSDTPDSKRGPECTMIRSWSFAMCLFVAMDGRAVADDSAIPQDPEKSARHLKETVEWNRRTLVGAYDRVGKKDPRWDAAVREGLEQTTRYYSKDGDRPFTMQPAFASMRKAIEAGCDDPMVVYLMEG